MKVKTRKKEKRMVNFDFLKANIIPSCMYLFCPPPPGDDT